MRYMGGKTRCAKGIALTVSKIRDGRPLYDPFCGGLASAEAFAAYPGDLIISDVHPGLIALYEGLMSGRLTLPAGITEDEYDWYRHDVPHGDPIRAFVEFGGSFGGKSWGSYARSKDRKGRPVNILGVSGRALTRKIVALRACRGRVTFRCADFLRDALPPRDSVVYLDPPYRGTASYRSAPKFDYDAFMCRARECARECDTLVSEYEYPHGHVVWSRDSAGYLSRGANTRVTERLYYLPPEDDY